MPTRKVAQERESLQAKFAPDEQGYFWLDETRRVHANTIKNLIIALLSSKDAVYSIKLDDIVTMTDKET